MSRTRINIVNGVVVDIDENVIVDINEYIVVDIGSTQKWII